MGALAHTAARRPVPRALALIVLVAALAALLVGYRPTISPPGLHPRQLALGAAQAEVLVDTQSSQLAGITPAYMGSNTLAAQLAVNYALYLQSNDATSALGRSMGLHGLSVAASGPFTLLLGRENMGPKRPTPPNPILVDHNYRLLLDVDGERPMLSIYAQAPTAGAAIELVNAARSLLLHHVRAEQPAQLAGEETVVLERARGHYRRARRQRSALAGNAVHLCADLAGRRKPALCPAQQAPLGLPFARSDRRIGSTRRGAPRQRRLASHHTHLAVGPRGLCRDAVHRPLRRDQPAGQPPTEQHFGPAAAGRAGDALAA